MWQISYGGNDFVDFLPQLVAVGHDVGKLGVEGFDINLLAVVFLLHIAADGEVVVVGGNVFVALQGGEVRHVLAPCVGLHNGILVLGFDLVSYTEIT